MVVPPDVLTLTRLLDESGDLALLTSWDLRTQTWQTYTLSMLPVQSQLLVLTWLQQRNTPPAA